MQINGAQIATTFIASPFEAKNKTRVPVTIDAETSFRIKDVESSTSGELLPLRQKTVSFTDDQQAQTVRLSVAENTVTTEDRISSSRPNNVLPKGIQQYIQVSQSNKGSSQRLLDELA